MGLGLQDGNVVLWDLLLLERQCKWKAHNAPISAIAFAHYSLSHGCNGKTHCNTLQHTATHCNTLQHTAAHGSTLQHTATHCNTLQHTATHYNTLQQRTATHYNDKLQKSLRDMWPIATHCNTLRHTEDAATMCYNFKRLGTMSCTPVFLNDVLYTRVPQRCLVHPCCTCLFLKRLATRWCTPQYTAQHCNINAMRCNDVLQPSSRDTQRTAEHTASYCNILQHIATCSTIYHGIFRETTNANKQNSLGAMTYAHTTHTHHTPV